MVLVFPAVCFADTINVPAAQPTIQAGIDAAVNGDTVLLVITQLFRRSLMKFTNSC